MTNTADRIAKAFSAAAIAVALSACSTMKSASSRFDVELDVYRAMAYGSIVELNRVDPGMEKNLLLRLYELPVGIPGCASETSGTCASKYYLSVSTFDEYPIWNVVALEHIGKLEHPGWIETEDIDSATISFTLTRYTGEAVLDDGSLAATSRPIRLLIQVIDDSVSISEIP